VIYLHEVVLPTTWGGIVELQLQQCRGLLNLCISDKAKLLLLEVQQFIPLLLDGLLLDPEHPRKDTDEQVKSAVQRDFTVRSPTTPQYCTTDTTHCLPSFRLRKVHLFLSVPYVCPEPVLGK
jgi:hypothetical protein